MTNLGHISTDRTKLKAKASNSCTLSKEEFEEIRRILSRGIAVDGEENRFYSDKPLRLPKVLSVTNRRFEYGSVVATVLPIVLLHCSIRWVRAYAHAGVTLVHILADAGVTFTNHGIKSIVRWIRHARTMIIIIIILLFARRVAFSIWVGRLNATGTESMAIGVGISVLWETSFVSFYHPLSVLKRCCAIRLLKAPF